MLASGRAQEQLSAVCLLRDTLHGSSGAALAHNTATVWRSSLPQQLADALSSGVQRGQLPTLHLATKVAGLLAMLLDGRAAGMQGLSKIHSNDCF